MDLFSGNWPILKDKLQHKHDLEDVAMILLYIYVQEFLYYHCFQYPIFVS